LKWGCEIHVNLVDEEIIKAMKSAGCNLLQLGIESGNNLILEQIRKGITIERALQACKIIENIGGIHLNTFFMAGFPGETEQTLRDTMVAMKRTRCDSFTFSIFTPYPGTELFQVCREMGVIDDNFDVSLYNHHSPNNYFSPNISQKKFIELISEIVKLTDNKNRWSLIRGAFGLGIRERLKRIKQELQ